MEALFLVALVGSVYSYLGYPLLLLGITAFVSGTRVLAAADYSPSFSIIITARNEADRISSKIADTVALFEGAKFEVIVVSDASTDGTDEVVRAVRDSRVRLVRQEERKGKESGQYLGILGAGGEILVFSDVATRIKRGSVDALAQCFADRSVGAVSSEDRFISADGSLAGEGLYVRYEMWLRRLESRLAGLVGLSGSFFAVRRDICKEWRVDVPSDFTVALTCARHGLRAVSHSEVVGIYSDLKQPADEYSRKRRTILRGMAGLGAAWEVLNPVRYGWFAFEVWSHKVLRWAVPWFLLLLFATNLALVSRGPGYAIFLAVQAVGYATVLVAWVFPSFRKIPVVRLGYYFVSVNLAMADAFLRFLRGERIVMWNPSRR